MIFKRILSLNCVVKICILSLLLVSKSAFAESLNFYTPKDDVNYHIVRAINSCSRSLELTASDIKSNKIAQALVMAKNRGVYIRILLTKKQPLGNDSQLRNILGNKIEAWVLEDKNVHINNFGIFDKKLLLTGSFTLDNGQFQNITFSNDGPLLQSYIDRFEGFANFKLSSAQVLLSMNPQNDPWGGSSFSGNQAGELETNSGNNWDQSNTQGNVSGGSNPPPGNTWSGDDSNSHQINANGMVKYSFEEMNRLFGKNSTLSKSEKKRLWKEYKGKYVTWTGKITYVAWGLMSGNIIGVLHTGNNEVIVEINPAYVPRVKGMHKGDTITYKGILRKRPKRFTGFKIGNAEVVMR